MSLRGLSVFLLTPAMINCIITPSLFHYTIARKILKFRLVSKKNFCYLARCSCKSDYNNFYNYETWHKYKYND
nr:MAG TPA: hypothetical protein [Bacteriophage sp.]